MSLLRILVVGDSQVGKTALTVRFLTRRFIGEYCSLHDALYRCSVDVESMPIQLEILDTVGKKGQSVDVEESHIKWANVFIVVYSVVNRASFQKAESMVDLIKGFKPTSPTLLLGNKADFDSGREVSVQDGQQLAHALSCTYHEVSAAVDIAGTQVAFQSVIKEALQAQARKTSSAKRRKNSLGNVSKRLGAIFGKKEASSLNSGDFGRNSVQGMEVVKL